MQEKIRRAEELLEERLRSGTSRRPTNGVTAEAESDTAEPAAAAAEPDAAAQSDATLEQLQRLAADFANYRRRNEADRADFARFAKAELIVKLLDVLDGYDRALATVPDDVKGQPWVEGMWLVERKFRAALEGEGLSAVECLGQSFDPYLHEAVAHLESDEPEGTVIQEYQKGYRLHDKVIRPALVAVAKAKE